MCGRIAQSKTASVYARAMGRVEDDIVLPEWQPNWNVPARSSPLLMHQLAGKRSFASVHWGYHPMWARLKKMPMLINASLQTVSTGPALRPLFQSGRAIIPADGWFEWAGEKENKQPWYVMLKNDTPMFLAAITDFWPVNCAIEDTGFLIVTTAPTKNKSTGADQRPIVLTAENAWLWMNNDLSMAQAEEIARETNLRSEYFAWCKVSER